MNAKPTAEVINAWSSLVRTERALRDKVEEDLKEAGLPPLDWYHVLQEIDGSPKDMIRQSDVQNRTQLAQYNICRLVDRLERDELVERHQCRQDGRNNILVITTKGRALRRAMRPVYARAVQDHFGVRLTRAEAEQLLALLAKLVES